MEDFTEKQEIKNNACKDKEVIKVLSDEDYESLTQYQKETHDRMFSQQRIEHNIDLTQRIEKLHADDSE